MGLFSRSGEKATSGREGREDYAKDAKGDKKKVKGKKARNAGG
jgi:hypothetical protein